MQVRIKSKYDSGFGVAIPQGTVCEVVDKFCKVGLSVCVIHKGLRIVVYPEFWEPVSSMEEALTK